MIKLDDDLLQELGLAALPPEEKKKLLAHVYETLEMRVGMKLAEQMSDAQLTEFEQFIDRNDEGGALKWLETNFPNYKDVVAAEFERLKTEIRQVAPQILSAGSAQTQQAQPLAAPVYPQQPVAQPQQAWGSAPPAQPAYPSAPPMPPQPQQFQQPPAPPAWPSTPQMQQPFVPAPQPFNPTPPPTDPWATPPPIAPPSSTGADQANPDQKKDNFGLAA